MSSEASSTTWRSRLIAPLLTAVAIACCLGAPLIIGATGALTAGALCGLLVGALALLVLCLWAAGRVRSDIGC